MRPPGRATVLLMTDFRAARTWIGDWPIRGPITGSHASHFTHFAGGAANPGIKID